MVVLEVGKEYCDSLGYVHVVLKRLKNTDCFLTKFKTSSEDERVYDINGMPVAPKHIVNNSFAILAKENKPPVEYDLLWLKDKHSDRVFASVHTVKEKPYGVTIGQYEILKQERITYNG